MTGLTRAEQAALVIRESIIEGEYVSGERLIELTLSKRMNISQSTIRDALRLLEHQGWVVKRARRGVYVRSFDGETAQEVLALLYAVEATAVEALVDRHAKLAEMAACVANARVQAAKGQRSAAIESLFLAHEALAEASGRELTAQLVKQLANQMRLMESVRQARIPPNFEQVTRYVGFHEELLRLLEEAIKVPSYSEQALKMLETVFHTYRDEITEALRL